MIQFIFDLTLLCTRATSTYLSSYYSAIYVSFVFVACLKFKTGLWTLKSANGPKCAICSENWTFPKTAKEGPQALGGRTGICKTIKDKYTHAQEFMATRKPDRLTSQHMEMEFMAHYSPDVPLLVYWDYVCTFPLQPIFWAKKAAVLIISTAPELTKLIFAVLYVSRTMGLTRCYTRSCATTQLTAAPWLVYLRKMWEIDNVYFVEYRCGIIQFWVMLARRAVYVLSVS